MSLALARRGSIAAGGAGGGGSSLPDLSTLIAATSPYQWWRLGESSGTTGTDEMASANLTYVGSPTLGATGMPGAGGDTAVTFNGSSQYATVGTLPELETAVGNGTAVDLVFHFKTTTSATMMALLGIISNNTIVEVILNAEFGTLSAGAVSVRVRDEGAGASDWQAISGVVGADLYDGNWHQLRVRINTTGTGALAFWFDGSKYVDKDFGNTISGFDWTRDWAVGARNNRGTIDRHFAGTLDEVFICPALTLAEAEEIRLRAIDEAAPTTSLDATPTSFITNTDVGSESVYWTRPYPYPDASGGGDEYLWLGSTDHNITVGGGELYRGFSAAPDTAPTTWTTFQPPGGYDQPETPFFVHDPAEASPYRLYYHPNNSDSGGNQQSRLVSHTTPAWNAGTDEGEVLPATDNISATICDHTGYMSVERRSATDWHAWSFTRARGTHGRAEYGYWTSSDGETWTASDDDLDVRSMLPSERQLIVRSLNRFTVAGITYAILTEHPDTATTGDNDADPGGQVVLCQMTDETTFVVLARLWEPADAGITDDLRDVRAFQDDNDSTLTHLYIHVNRSTVYYTTISL